MNSDPSEKFVLLVHYMRQPGKKKRQRVGKNRPHTQLNHKLGEQQRTRKTGKRTVRDETL